MKNLAFVFPGQGSQAVGMVADLYESYCGSILAAGALGVAAFTSPAILGDGIDG